MIFLHNYLTASIDPRTSALSAQAAMANIMAKATQIKSVISVEVSIIFSLH
jgi:hypothetical protein